MSATEPSDIVKVLRMAGEEYGDATCHALATHAERGEPILHVCHEAIRVLAAKKASLTKRLIDVLAILPPPPIIIPNLKKNGDT